MKEVVINRCFGGFSVSRAAFLRLRELESQAAKAEPDIGEMWDDGSGPRDAGLSIDHFCSDICRDDPLLVQVVREMGAAANGQCAKLSIVQIPDDVAYTVEEYDGFEHLAEAHRTWP